ACTPVAKAPCATATKVPVPPGGKLVMAGVTFSSDTASCDATTPPLPQDPQASTQKTRSMPTGLPRRNRTGLVIATPWRPRAQSLRSTLNTVPSDEDDGMARKLSRGSGQRNPTPAQLRPTRRGVAYLALPHGAPGCNGV